MKIIRIQFLLFVSSVKYLSVSQSSLFVCESKVGMCMQAGHGGLCERDRGWSEEAGRAL